jgi:hypothetical protein
MTQWIIAFIVILVIGVLVWGDLWRVLHIEPSIDSVGDNLREGFSRSYDISRFLTSDAESGSPHYRYKAFLQLLATGFEDKIVALLMMDPEYTGKSLRQLIDIQDNQELAERYAASLNLLRGTRTYKCGDELAQRLGIPPIWIGGGALMTGDSISGLRYLLNSREPVDRHRAFFLIMESRIGLKPHIVKLLTSVATNPNEQGSICEILIKINDPYLSSKTMAKITNEFF